MNCETTEIYFCSYYKTEDACGDDDCSDTVLDNTQVSMLLPSVNLTLN